MNPIIKEGVFDASIRDQINQNLQQAGGVLAGDIYFVNPFTGAGGGYDGNTGLYPSQALGTLAAGYNKLREGKNDVLALISNGLTTATARLSSAFTWSKNAAHLVGVCAPGIMSQRSRIAPTSGVTAFANLFTVSGSGCLFQNVQWFHGFGTGTTAQICLAVSGGRNVWVNCHIAGMGDAASAADAGSRSLKITSTGENFFKHCCIGIDTVARSAANASVEFGGVGNPRNVFEDCLFPFMCSAATPLGILVSAAAASDRFQLFRKCQFINAVKSTSTTMDALATLAANIGGMIVLEDPLLIGVTAYGTDATSKAQMYILGPTPNNGAGIAVNPA